MSDTNSERDALVADLRRCLDDVSTEMRARGRDDSRFVQLAARLEALAAPAEGGQGEIIDVAENQARAMYSAWCDEQGIHSNRLPAWCELSDKSRGKWLDKAVEPDTGNPEADNLIGRLMRADPTFSDCTDAAALIRKLAMINSAGGAKGEDDARKLYEPDEYADAFNGRTPQPSEGDGAVDYEFQVWQNGEHWAGGSASTLEAAQAEARHYAMMYGQDGPVEVRMFEKREITAARAAAPAAPKGGGVDAKTQNAIDNAHDNYLRGNIDATTRDYLIEKAKTAALATGEQP